MEHADSLDAQDWLRTGPPASNDIDSVSETSRALRVGQQTIDFLASGTLVFENECCLLVPAARERLKECRRLRKIQLLEAIKVAVRRLRNQPSDWEPVDGKYPDNIPAAVLRQKAVSEILDLSSRLVEDGIRCFADGLLASHGRLGSCARSLRQYTAALVNEIRSHLSMWPVLEAKPLLPWTQDRIAQHAIQACEEIIAERRKSGTNGVAAPRQ
jgi:hypothetical protein